MEGLTAATKQKNESVAKFEDGVQCAQIPAVFSAYPPAFVSAEVEFGQNVPSLPDTPDTSLRM